MGSASVVVHVEDTLPTLILLAWRASSAPSHTTHCLANTACLETRCRSGSEEACLPQECEAIRAMGCASAIDLAEASSEELDTLVQILQLRRSPEVGDFAESCRIWRCASTDQRQPRRCRLTIVLLHRVESCALARGLRGPLEQLQQIDVVTL